MYLFNIIYVIINYFNSKASVLIIQLHGLFINVNIFYDWINVNLFKLIKHLIIKLFN